MNKKPISSKPVLRVDLPAGQILEGGGKTSVLSLRVRDPRERSRDKNQGDHFSRAQLHFHQGQFKKAYADFCLAAQQRSQQAISMLMASRCLLHSGKPRRALALLESSLEREGWSESERLRLHEELTRQKQILMRSVRATASAASQAGAQVPAAAPLREATAPVAAPETTTAELRPGTKSATNLYAAATSKLVTVPFTLLVTAVIVIGFLQRNEGYLIAESGLGYLLGIVGSLLMVVLMLYPMRKKMRFMRNWGPIPYWFRFHMLAGIIGPVMILFHANFHLGSLNSQVVLGSTLLVASSGIFGRYLYTKIHYGLYGKRASLEQLHEALATNQDNLVAVFAYAPKIQQRLLDFDEIVLRPSHGLLPSIGRVLLIDLRRYWTELRIRLSLRRALRVAAQRNNWSRREAARQHRNADLLIKRHFVAVLKVAEFSFYERFFSFWHIFHMPLFLLLLVALVIHVIAVHMY